MFPIFLVCIRFALLAFIWLRKYAFIRMRKAESWNDVDDMVHELPQTIQSRIATTLILCTKAQFIFTIMGFPESKYIRIFCINAISWEVVCHFFLRLSQNFNWMPEDAEFGYTANGNVDIYRRSSFSSIFSAFTFLLLILFFPLSNRPFYGSISVLSRSMYFWPAVTNRMFDLHNQSEE